MYQVVMLNDDYTPMEFVVLVLQEFFNKDREAATQIMLKIHLDGNINNSANQTIVFTNGANQGLDVTLASLVSQKAFVLDAVV